MKRGFESSSSLTPEFAEFFRTFKSELSKGLKQAGAENIKIGRGHFYISGFFTLRDQVWYINFGDVRWSSSTMLFRTAKNYTDYTGGSNRYVDFGENMVGDLLAKIA